MVYTPNLKTFAGRLEHVWRTCGYESESAFAKALGATQQKVQNWSRRASFGRAGGDLHRLTGVNTDWLRDGAGEPFPGGPTNAASRRLVRPGSKEPASVELQLLRHDRDIDALRNMLNALASAIAEASPNVGSSVASAVRAIEKAGLTDRGSYAEFLQVLDEARDNSEAALQAAERREASRSS